MLRRFAEGDLQVIWRPAVLDEGVDVPEADLAVIVGASRSRRQMIQRMGRVLRKKADHRRARLPSSTSSRRSRTPPKVPRRRSCRRSQMWLTTWACSEAVRRRSTPPSSFFVASAVSVATDAPSAERLLRETSPPEDLLLVVRGGEHSLSDGAARTDHRRLLEQVPVVRGLGVRSAWR